MTDFSELEQVINFSDLEQVINFTDFEQLITWVIIAGFSCVIFSLAVLASKR